MSSQYKCTFTNNGKELTTVTFNCGDDDLYIGTWAYDEFIRNCFTSYMNNINYSWESNSADIQIKIEKVVKDD
jgi:acyl CoA:acetate/3-ketoacid CoA transferase alpha subunit